MKELPNLDWNKLRDALLLKKALETTEEPESPRPRRTQQRSVPQKQVPSNEFAGAFQKIQQDIEALEEQAKVEATETHDYGKMKSLRKKVDDLKDILTEAVDSEEVQSMIEMQVPQEKIIPILDRLIGGKRKHYEIEGVPNLVRHLEDAILEERYEDAAIIQEQINRLKKLEPELVKGKILSQMVITADNLDLVEINKPYDEGLTRKRHQFRYRNEPGGSDELFWEGMDGTKNKDKGIGSDQYSDVGSPASGNFANDQLRMMHVLGDCGCNHHARFVCDCGSVHTCRCSALKKDYHVATCNSCKSPLDIIAADKPKLKPVMRPLDVNMPNEKMERDPQEEKATTDTWREFLDMQEK